MERHLCNESQRRMADILETERNNEKSSGSVESKSGSNIVKFAYPVEQSRPVKQPLGGLDLKSRLYDRPEDAQVFQRLGLGSKPKGSGIIPSPPTGRPNRRAAFRTTFFKEDRNRLKQQREKKKNRETDFKDDISIKDKRKSDNVISVNGNHDVRSEVKDAKEERPALEKAESIGSEDNHSVIIDDNKDDDVISVKSHDTDIQEVKESRPIVLEHLDVGAEDIVFHILRLRRKLGLTVELPRHGVGVRENLSALEKTIDGSVSELADTSEDTGEFLYGLPMERNNPRGRYMPYDLEVVSTEEGQSSKMYFTASATSVGIHIEDSNGDEYLELTPILQWLYERRLFKAVYNQPVFVKFRMWKAFTVWKKNVRGLKMSSRKAVMIKQLFTANELLQRCLLHVQAQCEAAASSRLAVGVGDKAISLLVIDQHVTLDLDQFCAIQAKQCNEALDLLNRMRSKLVKVCWECCVKVAEMEGVKYNFQPHSGPLMKKVSSANLKNKNTNGPTYTEIAQWRNVLARLSKFLRAADYLILNLLRRLVKNAVKTLTEFFQTSLDTGIGMDADENDPEGIAKRNLLKKAALQNDEVEETKNVIDKVLDEIKEQEFVEMPPEPVFQLKLVLNVPERTSTPGSRRSSHSRRISEERSHLQSPQKKSVTFVEQDSDSSSDSENEEESSDVTNSDDEDENEDEDGNDTYAYPESHRNEVADVIDAEKPKVNITLQPSQSMFVSKVQGIIAGFEHTVGQVQALQREPHLAVFWLPPCYDLKLSVDREEEEAQREQSRPWPDLELLFGEDPEYQTIVANTIDLVSENLDVVQEYAEEFQDYCAMVERSQQIEVEKSMKRKEWSTEEFHRILGSHSEMIRLMKDMTKLKRKGMIQVESLGFQEACIPYPTKVMTAVQQKLPVICNRRNEHLMQIIKSSSKKLDHMPKTVEEFVEHLSFLGRIGAELSMLEQEYVVVTKLFTIANDFGAYIAPEELALYQTLMPSFQHLKSTIIACEARKDENISKFSDDLKTHIQTLHAEAFEMRNRVNAPGLLSSDTLGIVALERLKLLNDEVGALTTKARSYASYQDRFGSSISSKKKVHGYFDESFYSKHDTSITAQQVLVDLSELERDLQLRSLLWESSSEWESLVEEWTATQFDQLKVDSVQKNVNKFTQTVFMLEKGLPANEVLPTLKENVVSFKKGMPVISSLRNPALRSRHWKEIQDLIGRNILIEKKFSLGKLLELQVFEHKDRINDISTQASNEATLEVMLTKVIDFWQGTDFRLVPHGGRDIVIISGADDITIQLEESQVTVATIRGSRYVTPIKALVEEWDRKLNVFSRTLDEWMTCQRNWLYLEQIFSTPDIQRQLPSEAKLFIQVDKSWKEVMRRTEDRPNALRAATAPGVLEILQANNSNLEKIQKCLEDYLETKRLVFPRFYFLSNDELLDILAQSKNPEAVQPHLVKCFGNIKSLEIVYEPKLPPTVATMISAEGEAVLMPKNVRARGPVEQWLGSVESGMFDTVKRNLKESMHKWGGAFSDWTLDHPGQIILTVAQIMFNRSVITSMNSNEPATALEKTCSDLINNLNTLAGLVTENLATHQRMSVEAFITILVHSRDILMNLIQNKVFTDDSFEWQRQLRYEWDEQHNSCQVRQANASFLYGYEYLGCSARLVITPLTDRCYLTLTGALHLHLGGSPAGPAGTGKTETVKDLAKGIGKHCLVFNCSEGLDYKTLGKFFSGLAQSGSWCCFDEFNRIDVEVLSVVAQQLHSIKTAKDASALRFMFEGRDTRLNHSCGVFITMNPGYAGRVELPDNLKSLFRQVSMMVPDYTLIAEILLFAGGFTTAKSLSSKIVNLYQLASKQLSQQDHYDFGMRAIKSVLVMAGQRKRGFQGQKGRVLNEEEESHLLIHSLRDANLPKFIAEDVPLFENILADLFPGINPPSPEYGNLEKAISMAVHDLNVQPWPAQLTKVQQLFSQLQVRHGVMLVGPSGGGKTMVRNILHRALVLLPTLHTLKDEHGNRYIKTYGKKGRVETSVINPKCVNMGELYGETNPNTLEWSDGLLPSVMRHFSKEAMEMALAGVDESDRPSTTASNLTSVTRGRKDSTSSYAQSRHTSASSTTTMDVDQETVKTSERENDMSDETPNDWHWLVLDGPVDTLWIENLNTVLDDSKLLCLASGERISMARGMRLLFEVDNLSQASPATISRCAMIYIDPVDLGWKPYVKTWISKLPKEFPESGKKHLHALFERSVDRGLDFVHAHAKQQHVPATDMNIISMLCHLLSAFVNFMGKNGGYGKRDATERSGDSRQQSGHSSRLGFRKTGSKLTSSSHDSDAGSIKSGKEWYMNKSPDQLPTLLGKLFVFCFTWSVGGNLKRVDDADDDGGINLGSKTSNRKVTVESNIAYDFDGLVRDTFDIEPPLGVRLPSGSRTIFNYFVNMENGKFVSWDVLVPSTKSLIDKGVAHVSLGEQMGLPAQVSQKVQLEEGELVTTVDTIRYSFLTSLLLLNKHPVLITGDSGVGKSAVVTHVLKRLARSRGASTEHGTILGEVLQYSERGTSVLSNIASLTSGFLGDDDFQTGEVQLKSMLEMGVGGPSREMAEAIVSTTLQLSAQTKADRIQAQIQHKLIKKGKNMMVAPRGKRLIVFVDDLNLPAPEEFGAQPPLELIRQFLEFGGFYDTKKLLWKDILDVTLIGACAPPGGGRQTISPRLLKYFSLLSLPQPSIKSLQHIYQVQLGRFVENQDFLPEVKELLNPMVSASIAIYYKMCLNLLPTPAKTHYTFNLRDLSKVIQGLLQADKTVVTSMESAGQLLAHEATRVFHDRLMDVDDRMMFFSFLEDDLHNHFKLKWSAEQLFAKPLMFGDFMDVNAPSAERIYRAMPDPSRTVQVLEDYLVRMNFGTSQGTQIVFFKEAVEHIVRAARVFRQPGGHMLLVGMDGTGKSTTVQLACLISGCELFRLNLTRTYNISDYKEDLKKGFWKAGLQGLNTVFLMTDSDIVMETFLEDISCILNSGEVPDLFDNDDMESISMELKRVAAEAEIPDTRDAMYQYFIQRVRRNLHVVIATSPAGNTFRQRCRMYPSLINCCTLDWFDKWGEEAMLKVAQVYLGHIQFDGINGLQDIPLLKDSIAKACVDIHNNVETKANQFKLELNRHFYTTPSSYLDLIQLYTKTLKETKQKFLDNKNMLILHKCSFSDVAGFAKLSIDTEILLEQLKVDQAAVDQVREIVVKEETVMKQETQMVQDYADQAQRDLESVIPALQEAVAALDALDKSDISEIRVYTNPPDLVMHVMGAVCVLMKHKPEWSTAKHLLADQGFLKKLVNYDKSMVTDKIFARLKKFTSMPNFEPEKVGQVSHACKSICQWVLALQHYLDVCKMVKPKQRRVEEAKEALSLAQESLKEKQDSLAMIEMHLSELQKQYDDSVNQREMLQERKVLTTLRLQRASVLLTALADEKIRWAESMDDLNFRLEGIVGDTLVSTASIIYLGVFTAPYRREMGNYWYELCKKGDIPISQKFSLIETLTEANVVQQWHNEGLPRDKYSEENAIFVKFGHRWPLLIDPQGQGARWIAEMEGGRLRKVQMTDPNYMRVIERAVQIGEPVLLEEIGESLDPALAPILNKQLIKQGGQDVIKMGDTEIEYNHNFRLYMCCGLPNPHFLPAVCIKVGLINFTVTFEGLQDQLLSTVVQQEQPLLERQRGELLESIANDTKELRDLEDRSLSLLQKSQGHILDDQDLVETLEMSKKMSEEIHQRLLQSEITQKELDHARKKYISVATRGAILYFVLADLASIDVMYQFSLPWFQEMFCTCISQTKSQISSRPSSGSRQALAGRLRPSSARSSPDLSRNLSERIQTGERSEFDLEKHLQNMVSHLTKSIYRVVSKALFVKHQLVFSFLLCSSIKRVGTWTTEEQPVDHAISDTEWQTFLQTNVLAELATAEQLQKHDGLTAMQRLEAEAGVKRPPGSRGSSASSVRSTINVSGHVTSKPPKWISESCWKQCQYLSMTLNGFQGLCHSIVNNIKQWEMFVRSEDPFYLIDEPAGTSEESTFFRWENLKLFERIIMIKVLKPECQITSVKSYIKELMGAEYLARGGLDLKEVFDESSAKHPLIFILSPGVDPTVELMRFAKDQRGSTLHLDMISLGRGQGPKAEELIAKAQILKGRWVFLQNCHLAASFMPRLQAIVEGFNKPHADVDPQFRLWLSSKPDPSFPVSILQVGLKMTVESPHGLKGNLQRSLTSSLNEALWDDGSPSKSWKNLLFGLCFFNAVVHERKKYGTLGWNIPYEFTISDLHVSIQVLQMLLSREDMIPWPALEYQIGEVGYGGRVTDNWDRRCLGSILKKYFCQEALEPGYFYSDSKTYHPLAKQYSLQDVQVYIDGLPDIDSPDIFGMHANAQKAFQEKEGSSLISIVASVQPRWHSSIGGVDMSSDSMVKQLLVDIQNKLPTNVVGHDDDEGDKPPKTKASRDQDPSRADGTSSVLDTVLHQEIGRFDHLLKAIHKSSKSLRQALKGEVVMSEQLEEMYYALLAQKVPTLWKVVAYASCKPLGAWLVDLQQRVDFFACWQELTVDKKKGSKKTGEGTSTEMLDMESKRTAPSAFWLSAFFFPQGFTTAILQKHARQHQLPVDSLTFTFQVMSTRRSPDDQDEDSLNSPTNVKELVFKEISVQVPDEGVLVFGLFLDGAHFNRSQGILQDSLPDSRFSPMPYIHFLPTKISFASSHSKKENEGLYLYQCPVYRTSARAGTLSSTGLSTNFVTAVDLPTYENPELWITRGVALLCQLDD
ncbi:dynein heavy chain 6, axonemal-like [Anneissia japonica]|uniref:dynein heavy chain 6, axonemal-like n=1 Tax=Anneissia japonica TaxID=1529436 RepID=UPI0014259E3B|nr:dynein heavy chain 6, axonemal-like [Anneissia japonica]